MQWASPGSLGWASRGHQACDRGYAGSLLDLRPIPSPSEPAAASPHGPHLHELPTALYPLVILTALGPEVRHGLPGHSLTSALLRPGPRRAGDGQGQPPFPTSAAATLHLRCSFCQAPPRGPASAKAALPQGAGKQGRSCGGLSHARTGPSAEQPQFPAGTPEAQAPALPGSEGSSGSDWLLL